MKKLGINETFVNNQSTEEPKQAITILRKGKIEILKRPNRGLEVALIFKIFLI